MPWFGRRNVGMRNRRPIVSFTFDDFPRSAAAIGGEILREFDGTGTYYLSGGIADGFDVAQLGDLVNAGHELGCHTYSHLDCGLADEAAILADIDANTKHVQTLLPGYTLRNFAYPYGNVSISAKSLLGQRFRSCRGIFGGAHSGCVDTTLLHACKLYSDTVPQARRTIDLTARTTGWLILFTHDVDLKPTPYGISPADFRCVVEYARKSGCLLLTVDAALDAITDG